MNGTSWVRPVDADRGAGEGELESGGVAVVLGAVGDPDHAVRAEGSAPSMSRFSAGASPQVSSIQVFS